MVACCQGASGAVVAVVAVDEVEAEVVVVVDPEEELVPVEAEPLEVVDPVLVEVPASAVVEVLLELALAPVATTEVRGRSVTSAPAAFTAT
jgi:hypothetical protein